MICVVALFACGLVIVARAAQLQLLQNRFLESRADAQQVATATVVARRGRIFDRNGQPLAVSAPVDSFWAHPNSLDALRPYLPQIAAAFGSSTKQLEEQLARAQGREFVWLKRGLPPSRSRTLTDLGAPGLRLRREYRRYYPAGEFAGHLVGFADIDENGQEGLELAFDSWLKGRDGRKQVIRDRLGRHVRDIAGLEPLQPGRDLHLGLDLRIQYLAYRELREAMDRHQARSGSIVVLDARSGEVLAMASQPSFNPNDRDRLEPANYRNRAVLDLLEPGSIIKPLVVAAALESGTWSLHDRIDTGRGFVRVGSKTIRDRTALGVIDFATLLRRSSQVGTAQVAMSLEPQRLWGTLAGVGLARAVRAMSRDTAAAVALLLEEPVGAGGTATRAGIPGYRVAGKTGTVEKLGASGYEQDRHTALFVGFAPASNPRVAAAVVIDEPLVDGYFGGEVAAPVFSRVVLGALRIVGAPMDGVRQPVEATVAAR